MEAIAEATSALAAGQLDLAGPAIARAVEHVGRRCTFMEIAREMVSRNQLGASRALVVGLAQAWLREGAPAEAASILEVVAFPEPHDSRVDQLLGESLVKSEQHTSALVPLLRARANGNASLEMHLYLATAYWETGNPAAAESELRNGLAASGGDALWHHQLGRLLLWQGRGSEAAMALGKASEQQPNAIDLHFDLGRALALAGDLDAASSVFRSVIEQAPQFSQAYYGLAQLQRRQGQTQEAATTLVTFRRLVEEERLRTRQQGVASARLNHGWDLLRRGESSAAIDHFSALDETAEALRGLASAYDLAGQGDDAIVALQRAVVLAPEDHNLRQLLASQRLAYSRVEVQQ